DGANQDLTRNFAKTIYNNTPALKSAEITGRHGDIQINPDGTKTMVVGGEKMIYQWNADLDIVTQQTEESKRVAEVLDGLKLGPFNSETSSQDDNIAYIKKLPTVLTNAEIDTDVILGSGAFKIAHAFRDNPNLIFLALIENDEVQDLEKEVKMLGKLNKLGVKTPKFYQKTSFTSEERLLQHGLIAQRIVGAEDLDLDENIEDKRLPQEVLDYSNQQTLRDIRHLQQVFIHNPNLIVSDFQGIIGKDGQLYIIDPMRVDNASVPPPKLTTNHEYNLFNLMRVEESILEHHRLFTESHTNHIIYIDKNLWESNDELREKLLKEDQGNKVIVQYDALTNEKTIITQPDNFRDLIFDTIEVITDDPGAQNADLQEDYMLFAEQEHWIMGDDLTFRANSLEGYNTLNLRSNGKNKHNVILRISDDSITRNAAESLYKKHPENSIIVTLDERGRLVFPRDVAFNPDDSVRLNIIGHPSDLEQVGARNLVRYTTQITEKYNMNSLQNESYLNRVALVGCESQELSKAYAKQFYTLRHLRGTVVTGRVGDMQINPDGGKTMEKGGQKIIHNWDYEGKQPVWQTIDAKRTGKILKSLKLGLGDTPSNIPDSLDYNDIGNKEGDGIMKTAYTLKDHPNLLFLQLDTETPLKVEKLEHEIAWINKMRELGIKTPEYYKAIVMTDQNHQKHHGILVERIPDAKVIRPDSPNLMKNEYITKRTLDDIQSLSDKFEQNPDLYIPDLQMLMGKDGQLYVFDPGSADSPMHQPDSPANQIARSMNMKELKKLIEKATLFLGKFNESNRMHAIFVDEALLKKDPNLEEKLINKAKKQQDLAIFSYNFEGMLVEPTLLYQPDNSQPIDRIEVMADKGNRSPNQIDMSFLTRDMPNISNDMIFRCRPAENFSNYRTNIIVQHGNSDTAIKAAQDLANKHPDNSIIVHFDADNKLVTSNNEFYTPKGNVRLSFVDHGGNFVTDESNMDNLIDKVKQITDTYGNENTYFERIALVGCDTDGVGKTLTKDFARAVYSDIPTLRNADITGRAGEVQVNDDGTKTMKTGGAKTVYSWDEAVEGNIKERSETVKRYSDSLENPLGKFDDQIREIDRLLDIKPMSESTEKILTDTRNALLEINLAYHTAPDNLSHIVSLLARHELKLKAYLDEHEDTQVKKSLEAFCDSLNIQGNNIQFEIDAQLSKEFSEILKWAPENQTLKLIAFHEKLLSKKNQYSQLALLTHQSLKEVKRSVSATLDKVEDIANKASTLDAEEKIKALAEANKYINYLHANLKYFKEADQTRVKEFKTKILPPLELSTWHRTKVVNTYRVPLVDDNAFRIVVQLSGDTDTANGAAYLAGKHFGNSTLVQIDKYGNYKVVHGPELKDIPDGKKAKFVFLGHGNSIKKTMGGRVASDMAKHILDLKLVIPKTVDITAVAIKGCCAGADYGKDILTELNKEKFRPLVTSKPGHTKVDHSGRQLTDGIYHSEDNRTAWKYNKDNKIVTIPYSDDKHHIVLAIDEHGEPKVIKTHDNKNWKEFKGELRVRIVAGGRMKTVDALMEFQEQLRDQGATMRQIDVEMGDQNWVGDSSTALHDYGGYARSMSDFIESNIAFHLDSGAHEGSTIFSYKDAPNREQLVFNPGYSIKSSDTCLSDRITLDYDKDNRPLLLTSTESDSDIFLSIYIGDADYKKEWVLSQLQKAKEVAGNSSILKVRVLTNTKYLMPIKDGRDLVNYLSQELEVRTEARHKGVNDSQFRLLLSKNPGDSEVKMEHLAETTSHRNIPLHNWGDLSQEQINKLAAESQRTKPSLVNHDYQVLIQTEADDNVKDSTLKLASKHPTQTTIVQMQKDGTYKVVYGLELKDIIGKVKMVAVGYGREKNGVQTLGGRNESELSDNILTLKRDLNPTNTTIGRTSLVGCNLESNNPTNNPDSQYGKQVIQRLHQGGINGDLSVRSS
ncbi:C80 family cysteine peptidase, partial [Bathymodiolus thermophilus thioautotrophic gill symbiont]